MNFRWMAVVSIAATFGTTSALAEEEASGARSGAVYVLSNDATSNAVLIFDRAGDGSLHAAGSVATGGTGSGGGLGSQGALVASRDRRWLFAVNPGSHSVAALRVERSGQLALVDVADTGGDLPVSITEADGLVYVVNAGARQNISGFTFDGRHLQPLHDSIRALSQDASVGAAQVSFTPDGDALVVTEKGTNRIDTFAIGWNGTPSDAVVTASAGETPFGFAFDRRGALVVSDAYGGAAGAGALSSYRVEREHAQVVTGPVADGRTAPCWVVVTRDGRHAFTSNAHDGTLSSYAIARDGALTLENGLAASIGSASAPTDMGLDDGFLYVRDGGTHAIEVFRVGADASLVSIGAFGALPGSANGLVAL